MYIIFVQKGIGICSEFSKKQEAHGPYSSTDKQFQSINTFAQSYDYTIRLIKKKKLIITSYLTSS